MKQRYRLRRQSDFQAAMGGRRFHSGRALVGFATPGVSHEARVGVTASRAIKGSVERNRVRRRVREVARKRFLGPDSPLRDVGIRYDVVLVARLRALDVSFVELEEEASLAALRLSRFNP